MDKLHVRWIEQIIGDGDYDTLTIPGYLDGVDA
jgi:hypothetical protein